MAKLGSRDPANGEAQPFAIAHARGQLRHLARQLNRALKSPSADAVHDVRVAIRRFSQAVAVCRNCIPGSGLPKHRRRMKKIMTGAGEVRNCDIALKFVGKFQAPHAIHLRAKVEGRRKESATLLVAELRKWKARRMPVKWRTALNSAETSKKEPIHALAHRSLSRAAKDFLKRGQDASSSDASPKLLHHFRIEAKKFRYTLELFQPLYPSTLDPLVESVKYISTLLGDINDCVTVCAMVAEYKGGNRLADRLKKRQHKKTEEFRKHWTEFSAAGQLRSVDQLQRPEQTPKKPVASSQTASRKSTAA